MKKSIKAIILAVLEEGVHLFPSRTQKLSLPSLMLLRFARGKVGRRQDNGFYHAIFQKRISPSLRIVLWSLSLNFAVRELIGL